MSIIPNAVIQSALIVILSALIVILSALFVILSALFVILSAAKDLPVTKWFGLRKVLRCAQDDGGGDG